MATTSLWQVSGAPAKVLKYAANPEKTENVNSDTAVDPQKQIGEVMRYTARDEKTDWRLLVTGIRCSPNPEKAAEEFIQTKRAWGKTGGVACFHGYQSFSKGEVTPEQAHEIGIEYAKRVWGDRFEVLVTTHIDKESHIHNHVILNSVSVVDGKKYDNSHADHDRMMSISDENCRDHGLSVIEKPKGRTKQYGEWLADKSDPSPCTLIPKMARRADARASAPTPCGRTACRAAAHIERRHRRRISYAATGGIYRFVSSFPRSPVPRAPRRARFPSGERTAAARQFRSKRRAAAAAPLLGRRFIILPLPRTGRSPVIERVPSPNDWHLGCG